MRTLVVVGMLSLPGCWAATRHGHLIVAADPVAAVATAVTVAAIATAVSTPPPVVTTVEYYAPGSRPGFVWVNGRWVMGQNGWVWQAGFWQAERRGYYWVQGAWVPQGNQYAWVEGHWEAPRQGFVWTEGSWVQQGNGYVWVGGHWDPAQ
jgi:hypothetical protein